MGTALNRVIAALEAHGRGPRHYGSGAITAHCPGPGHWRGDLHPSLRVGWGKDCALVYCQAGCNLGDVLAAIGLTQADLFDQPRQRPARPACNQLKAAIGKARNLAPADRCLYLWLLWSANWDTAMIPAAFQPKSQRDLSAACGLPRMTVQQSTAHLAFHGWLSLTCTREGCERAGLHPGRGHRMVYAFPGIGDDCLGPKCRLRFRPEKAARAANLRLVSGIGAAAIITLGFATGGPSSPPTTYLHAKPAADLRVYAPRAAFYRPHMQPFTEAAS